MNLSMNLPHQRTVKGQNDPGDGKPKHRQRDDQEGVIIGVLCGNNTVNEDLGGQGCKGRQESDPCAALKKPAFVHESYSNRQSRSKGGNQE